MGMRGAVLVFFLFIFFLIDIRLMQDESSIMSIDLKNSRDVDGDGIAYGSIEPSSGNMHWWFLAIVVLLVWKLRVTVRKQNGIAGSDGEDCFLSCCCTHCVLFQMAHQVSHQNLFASHLISSLASHLINLIIDLSSSCTGLGQPGTVARRASH